MAKKKKTAKKGGKKKEMLIVGSKTKEALKGSGRNRLNVSADALEALNAQVYDLIEKARTRTTSNGRKTVRGQDF